MAFDDTVLAMAELSQDIVFGKIPLARYHYYIEASLNAGYEAAQACKGIALDTLYDKYSAEVEFVDKAVRYGGVRMRAQTVTENGNTKVQIYRDSIADLVANSQWQGVPNIDFDTAVNTHLCHELFHVMEAQSGYISDKLDSVVTWKLFGMRGQSHVVRCSEIAAHSFAKEMLELPWLPNFYDYTYLLEQKQLSQEAFFDFFERMQHLVTTHDKEIEL